MPKDKPVNLDIDTVLTRYMQELSAMTQRAILAEATVAALQATKSEEPTDD